MSVLVTLEKWSADYDALFLRRNLAGARPRLTRRTAPRVSLRLRRPPRDADRRRELGGED
jgi:hypothetical protein